MLLSLAYREHENEKDKRRKWLFSFQVRFLEKAMLSRSLEINKLVTTSNNDTVCQSLSTAHGFLGLIWVKCDLRKTTTNGDPARSRTKVPSTPYHENPILHIVLRKSICYFAFVIRVR